MIIPCLLTDSWFCPPLSTSSRVSFSDSQTTLFNFTATHRLFLASRFGLRLASLCPCPLPSYLLYLLLAHTSNFILRHSRSVTAVVLCLSLVFVQIMMMKTALAERMMMMTIHSSEHMAILQNRKNTMTVKAHGGELVMS
jgi:hypothetical protein